MKKILKIILILTIFLFLFLFYLNTAGKPISENNTDNVFFVISAGEGATRIAENLYIKDLLRSKFYFKLYLWKNQLESKLQAGEYILNQSMDTKEIIEILSKGKAVSSEKNIKLLEGWTSKDMADYFEKQEMFLADDFMSIVGYPRVNYDQDSKLSKPVDYSEIYGFLTDKPKNYGLEGFLFPDTYKVYEDATPNDVVRRMLDNFDKKLTQKMRDDIKSQGKTIYEIVTMASFIEKEVYTYDDMRIVSGIFWNRLKIGKPLESCASLAYILGVNKPQYTLEDTKIDSPYNTYQNQGLPPGPIANPGILAIQAAIYPTQTDYYYFLSAAKTGETIFSKTYDEHLRNKAKYLP